MDRKLHVYVPAFRIPLSTGQALDHAVECLSMPRAQVIRLALIAGLPLVLKQVPQIQPDGEKREVPVPG